MFVICSITDMPRQLQHFVAPDAEGYALSGKSDRPKHQSKSKQQCEFDALAEHPIPTSPEGARDRLRVIGAD